MSAALGFIDNYRRIRQQFAPKPAPIMRILQRPDDRDVMHVASEPPLAVVEKKAVRVCRILYRKPIGPEVPAATEKRKQEQSTFKYVQQTVQFVCEKYEVHPRDLMGHWHDQNIVRARHHAWWLIRHNTNWSLPRIGKYFGKDHTTIISGVKRHAARMQAEASNASAN